MHKEHNFLRETRLHGVTEDKGKTRPNVLSHHSFRVAIGWVEKPLRWSYQWQKIEIS